MSKEGREKMDDARVKVDDSPSIGLLLERLRNCLNGTYAIWVCARCGQYGTSQGVKQGELPSIRQRCPYCMAEDEYK